MELHPAKSCQSRPSQLAQGRLPSGGRGIKAVESQGESLFASGFILARHPALRLRRKLHGSTFAPFPALVTDATDSDLETMCLDQQAPGA